MAAEAGLRNMNPAEPLPAPVLQVCRLLHEESAGYLYNSYLFNIVGLKRDCLALYKPFLETFRRHSRQGARIDAFSNGDHSATMCLSVQAGDSRLAVLNSRRRGKPRSIRELEEEVAAMPDPSLFETPALLADLAGPAHQLLVAASQNIFVLSACAVAVFAVLFATAALPGFNFMPTPILSLNAVK